MIAVKRDPLPAEQHTLWLANLRWIATISVILLHVAAPLLSKFGKINSTIWWYANAYDGFARFCVPVFVMITGALLLPKIYPIKTYFSKRLTRIVLPFLFWTFIYVLHQAYLNVGPKLMWQQFFILLPNKLLYGAAYHFWYIYMIIGLYLVIPVIGKWVRMVNRKVILCLILLWLGFIFSYPPAAKPAPSSNLEFIFSFVGYLLLGYYLATQSFGHFKYIKIISLFLFIIGVLVTLFGTYFLSVQQGAFVVKLYHYFAPNVVLAAIGIFLFCKHQSLTGKRFNRMRLFMNKHSFGIYFIHILVLYHLSTNGMNAAFINPLFAIPLTTFCALVISGLLIYLFKKIPYFNVLIG